MRSAFLFPLLVPALLAQVTAPPRPAAPETAPAPSYQQLSIRL